MNLLANENVYEPIIQLLEQAGHHVVSVRNSELSGTSDDIIYQKAVNDNLTIITMDKDFSRMNRFPPDKCAGIVVIKIYRHTVDETALLFWQHFNKLDETRIIGNLVIINPDGARVRKIRRE